MRWYRVNPLVYKLYNLTNKGTPNCSHIRPPRDIYLEEKVDVLEQEFTLLCCNNKKAMLDSVEALNTEVKSLKKNLATFVKNKENEMKRLNYQIEDVSAYCDRTNQHGRRNSLEIAGVKYHKGENTNCIAMDIFSHLGVDISMNDIDRSHRNPPIQRADRKNAPVILIKLLRHDLKELIYNRRHLLRELPGFKGIYINENLTPLRRKLYARVRRTFKHAFDCWTNDGKIHLLPYNVNTNKVLTITCYDDFYNMINDYF